MIGVRRLKLVPSTHSFDVCFRIYEAPEAFNPDEIQWNDYEDFYEIETYDERPLNWFEGDYSDIGPIFIDNNRKLNMLLTHEDKAQYHDDVCESKSEQLKNDLCDELCRREKHCWCKACSFKCNDDCDSCRGLCMKCKGVCLNERDRRLNQICPTNCQVARENRFTYYNLKKNSGEYVEFNGYAHKFRYQCYYGPRDEEEDDSQAHATQEEDEEEDEERNKNKYRCKIYATRSSKKISASWFNIHCVYEPTEKDSLSTMIHEMIDDIEETYWETDEIDFQEHFAP